MSFFDSELETKGDSESLVGILQSFGMELTEDLIANLNKKVRGLTSKNLQQSIRFEVTKNSKGYTFKLFFDDYGEFIDEGVQGIGGRKADGSTWRVHEPSSRFKFRKNRKPRLESKDLPGWGLGKWAEVRGLNKWAIQNVVWRRGIKENEWFTEVIERDVVGQLINKLEKISVKGVEIDLSNALKGKIE